MEIASIFVSPIVSKLVDVVATWINQKYVAIKGVGEDLQKLSDDLKTINYVLEDAEQRAASDRHLRVWISDLKDAAFDAEDILDGFAAEARLGKLRGNLAKKHAASEIKKITERIASIVKRRKTFNLVASGAAGSSRSQSRATGSFEDKATVVGRDSDKTELIRRLKADSKECVIPIVGLGGIGKTTLARLIYNDEEVKKHFKPRKWVSVTANFNIENILKDMTESSESGNLSLDSLESRFRKKFGGKRFLIVLDDVWHENFNEWGELRKLLGQGGEGCRVLVTSRSENAVSAIMKDKTQDCYSLRCLPDQESWSLFENIAFARCSTDTDISELERIGREIVGKCKGLPLAVKAMGGLLSTDLNVARWKDISRHSIWELEEKGIASNKPLILPALKLSYDELESSIKQCFSYCSIFPKGRVFYREELVKTWVVEGFITPPTGQSSAGETGRQYFDELSRRSFFRKVERDENESERETGERDENERERERGERDEHDRERETGGERYIMHDVIHELAVMVSNPYCCQVKDNKSVLSEKNRYVSLLCRDLECSNCKEVFQKCNKMRTLRLPTYHVKKIGVQALDQMFRSMKYIRVLDLSSTSLSELPTSIEELKLLRSLDLSGTDIEKLPNSICKLWNLQRLKLLGCVWLSDLPKDLGKLVNLVYLELDKMFWFKCRTLPPRLGNLTKLQNLHVFPMLGDKDGYGIGELKDMANLTGKLHISNLENAENAAEAKLNQKESLEQLVLQWSDKDFSQEDEVKAGRVLKDLQPHSELKELDVRHFGGSSFPSWMTNDLRKLVILKLNHCTKCTTISVGLLPCLKRLYIKGMLQLEDWPESECHSLIGLHISNCPKLKKVPDVMANLKTLKIKECDSLKTLPVAPLRFLTLIDNLVLEDWAEKIIPVYDQRIRLYIPFPSLSSVLELKMEKCPNIQALPRRCSPRRLEIRECALVIALSDTQRIQPLALQVCSKVTLLKDISSPHFLNSLDISNLTPFPKLPHLPGLKRLYISECEDLSSLSEEEGSLKSLPSLQLLSFQGCPKLESLPNEGLPTALLCLMIGKCPILKSLGSKQTLRSLVSLKDLYLEDCPLIQSFPEDGLPSSLQHLEIHGCPLLIQQCQRGGTEWSKIEHVTDMEIGSA